MENDTFLISIWVRYANNLMKNLKILFLLKALNTRMTFQKLQKDTIVHETEKKIYLLAFKYSETMRQMPPHTIKASGKAHMKTMLHSSCHLNAGKIT